MSIRSTLTGATWAQIGTGPATVQVISPEANGVEVMVVAQAGTPSGNDGLVLNAVHAVQHFSLAQPIWGLVVQAPLTALVAVQPEAT